METATASAEALGRDLSFSNAAILNKGISLYSKSSFPNYKLIGRLVTGSLTASNYTLTFSKSAILMIWYD
jgi:hypothetical protein